MKYKIVKEKFGLGMGTTYCERDVKCSCGSEEFCNVGLITVRENQGTFGNVDELFTYVECDDCFAVTFFKTSRLEERK